MDLDATVVKMVDLSAVKIKDLKTRRIFLLADGTRSLRQIFQFSKFEESQGIEMAAALIEGGYITLGGTSGAQTKAAPAPVQGHKGTNDFTFTEDDIALLISEVSKYVGPIASLLVQKKVTAGQSFSPLAKKELFQFLASKIEDTGKREQFLTDILADFS